MSNVLPDSTNEGNLANPLHPVLGTALRGPWDEPHEIMYLAMGCFWGVERIMWQLPGVISTATGYMGGSVPHPSYEQVCTGRTGHAETVRVVFDPTRIKVAHILKSFWENHDPTQGNRQGNDVGSQYRSAIFYTTADQLKVARATRDAFQPVLSQAGFGPITTEIVSATDAGEFYLAERYHQAYLHHLPNGYCNHGPNGMSCPIGVI